MTGELSDLAKIVEQQQEQIKQLKSEQQKWKHMGTMKVM